MRWCLIVFIDVTFTIAIVTTTTVAAAAAAACDKRRRRQQQQAKASLWCVHTAGCGHQEKKVITCHKSPEKVTCHK